MFKYAHRNLFGNFFLAVRSWSKISGVGELISISSYEGSISLSYSKYESEKWKFVQFLQIHGLSSPERNALHLDKCILMQVCAAFF